MAKPKFAKAIILVIPTVAIGSAKDIVNALHTFADQLSVDGIDIGTTTKSATNIYDLTEQSKHAELFRDIEGMFPRIWDVLACEKTFPIPIIPERQLLYRLGTVLGNKELSHRWHNSAAILRSKKDPFVKEMGLDYLIDLL
jgi:hypothetical protein